MSNPRESSLLKTEDYRQQVAEWIFEGVLAYKRSQERPEDAARLKLAISSVPGTGSTAGTDRSVPKLEEVPNFRPKTNAGSVLAGAISNVSLGVKNTDSLETGVPGFRPNTNGPVTVTASTQKPSPTHIDSTATAVRKAEPVEPEVRRAIPVTPRKGE